MPRRSDKANPYREISRRKALAALGSGTLLGLAGCGGNGNDGGGQPTDGDGGQSDGSGDGESDAGGSTGTTSQQEYNLRIYTAPDGSIAYSMMQAVAAVFDSNVAGLTVEAFPAQGAKQGMSLMNQGDADLAYTDLFNANNIYNEQGDYEANPFDIEIQQVLTKFSGHSSFVTNVDEISTINDFPGHPVNPYEPGVSARAHVLGHLEQVMPLEEYDFNPVGIGDQPAALSEGRLHAAGDFRLQQNEISPPSYVEQIFRTIDDVKYVAWPDDIQSAIEEHPVFTGTYYGPDVMGDQGQWGDLDEVWWIDIMYNQFARADVPQEAIYRYLTGIVENMDALREYHPAFQAWNAEFLPSGLSEAIPLHTGAQQAYDELGVQY